MPNRITKGRGLFGSVNIANTGGLRILNVAFTGTMADLNQVAQSGITLGGGTKLVQAKWVSAVITPKHSAVASATTETRSYTTGLTSLSLTTDDMVILYPQTALASGLGICEVGVLTAAALQIRWINPHNTSAVCGFASDYKILMVRPSA